jgi:hypothetical protein
MRELALRAPYFIISSWTLGHVIAVSVIWKKLSGSFLLSDKLL